MQADNRADFVWKIQGLTPDYRYIELADQPTYNDTGRHSLHFTVPRNEQFRSFLFGLNGTTIDTKVEFGGPLTPGDYTLSFDFDNNVQGAVQFSHILISAGHHDTTPWEASREDLGYVIANDSLALWAFHADGSANTAPKNLLRIQLEYGNLPTDWSPAPEDLQGDSVNLMDGSAMNAMPSGWRPNIDGMTFGSYQGYDCLKCTAYGSGVYGYIHDEACEDGGFAVVSAWVYATAAGARVYMGYENSTPIAYVPEANKWVRISILQRVPHSRVCVFYKMDTTSGSSVAFRHIKIERGVVPTDWSPSLADQQALRDLQFIKQIFPTGLINNTATVSQLLAVRNSTAADAQVVAGIYGGGVKTLEDNGFSDSTHKKLMIFAGAENLESVANAATRIYEDGTIITRKLITEAAQINDSVLKNVDITGKMTSPFHSWDGATYAIGGDGPSEYYLYDNLSCAYVNYVSPGWTNFRIAWDATQNGRIITLANVKYQGSNAQYDMVFPNSNDGHSGYFFEDGNANTTLTVKKGEVVRLLGYGENDTFYGWIVLTRTLTNVADLVKPDILYQGIVEDGKLIKYKSWDGKAITVSKPATGQYRVYFPVMIDPSNYTVMMTGWVKERSIQTSTIYATLYQKLSNSFLVYTSDDESLNNGGFTFQVINTENWES